MKKRLLAGLLSLCLMLSMVPATALALDDGTETEPVATDTTSNSGTSQDSSMENSLTETGTDGKNTTETETTTNNENTAETETTTDDENADGETEEVPEKSEEDGSEEHPFTSVAAYNEAIENNDKNGADVYLTIVGQPFDATAQDPTYFELKNTQDRKNPPKLHLTLKNCNFTGNTANDTTNSSFMYLPNCQTLVMENCVFDTGSNALKYGINWNLCGIQDSEVTITGCTFEGEYEKNALKLNQRGGADDMATDIKPTDGDARPASIAKVTIKDCTFSGENAVIQLGSQGKGTNGAAAPSTGAFPVEISNVQTGDGPSASEVTVQLAYLASGTSVDTIPTIGLDADDVATKTAKGDLGTEDDFVAAVGDDQFVTTLASAFANAEEGSTITLLRDVELTSGIDVTNNVTLDLNGQTITISKDPSVRNAFIVNSEDVTFTIRDSGHTGAIRSNRTDNSNVISVSNGNLIVESGNISNQWYVIYVSGSGHATVRGGTLTSEVASVLSTNGSNSESPDYSDNAVMNVEGGKLVSTQDIAIYVPAGTLNVSGGEIVGATAIYAKSGITNITGGTIQGTGKKADFQHTSNGCYPTGDAIVIEACGYPNGEAAIQISGGSVSSDHNTALAYYQHDLNEAEKIEVSGGAFSTPVAEDFLASTVQYVASNADNIISYHANINDAIAAAGSTGTIQAANESLTTYTVTFDYNDPSKNDYTVSVVAGDSIQLPAPTRSGYDFDGWYVKSIDTTYQAGEQVTINSGITFIAQWDRQSSGGGVSHPTWDGSSSSSDRYDIDKPSNVDNGSIKVSPSSRAEAGDTVTITVTPDEGYELDELVVYDADGDEVDLDDEGDGAYTFEMPKSDVEIEVSFARISDADDETPVAAFVDVADSDWYADAVQYVFANGLMAGTSDTTFSPNATTTRAMIVTILYRLEGTPAVTGTTAFTDVAAGQYYADAVAWAAQNGIVSGTSATTFSPDGVITREQMAAILYRYAQHKGYDVTAKADLSVFTDAAQVSTYATDAMAWANASGLISGTSATTLSPAGSATRAQVATILMRFCENIAK